MIDWTGNVGPAFITALAAFVSSLALLIRARTAQRALSIKLERIEALSRGTNEQVNGKFDKMMQENRDLRDELDRKNTELSHSRRTVETLLDKRAIR